MKQAGLTQDRGSARPEDRSRPRPLALILLTVAVTGAAVFGLLPRWPGTIHFVALPPLDLMADLRVLYIYSPNPVVLAVGLVASLGIRSMVLAWMLGGVNRKLFGYALRFYLAALPLAALAAAMFYGAGAVLYYGLFWFALVATLVLFTLTAAAPWQASERLRTGLARAIRHGFRAGTVGAYLLALVVIGYAAELWAPVGTVVLVPASALLTYGAAYLLRVDPGYRLARRTAAGVAAAGLAALVLVAQSGPPGPPLAPVPEDPLEGSVMLMSGIDSLSGSGAILEIDPHYMGWTCEQAFYYSYAGPGDGQPRRFARCPITHGAPYQRADTLSGTEKLVSYMTAQVEEMISPATVAGHSQGVWLVWEAAARDVLPNVESIVLVGAFPQNPVPYPTWDEPGPGWAGRRVLSLLEGAARPGGTSVFEADSPLGREWLGHPTAIEDTLDQPLPEDISALNVPSVFDLPLMPGGYRVEGATDTCPVPVIHPDLPYAREFQNNVRRFVTDQPIESCPFWREQVGPLFHHFSAVAPDYLW